jgi:hypothetical protein
MVGFSDQVVARLREQLVEHLGGTSPAERERARALAAAARRLTGVDASRSGLGGFRWQLELCLLAAATDDGSDRAVPAPAARRGVTDVQREPAPSARPATPPERPSPDVPAPGSGPAASVPPAMPIVWSPAKPPAAGPATPVAEVLPVDAAATLVPLDVPASPMVATDDLLATVRRDWPAIVAAIGANPANRPLISGCRPVEVRDGILVLGFPEDQAFLRDIAERKRLVLEDGIASVIGRVVGVRCVVTNLELVPAADPGEDLVAQARRIFEGELVGVEDIE